MLNVQRIQFQFYRPSAGQLAIHGENSLAFSAEERMLEPL